MNVKKKSRERGIDIEREIYLHSWMGKYVGLDAWTQHNNKWGMEKERALNAWRDDEGNGEG